MGGIVKEMRVSKALANRDNFFYSSLAVLITLTGFAGFSFTYFGPMIAGSYPETSLVLHLHGWSFFLWYLLFPFQAILIARGKYRLHMTLGRLSPFLVLAMTLTGILVLTVRVHDAVLNGGPPIWLLYGPLILSNLVLFVIFYAAGVYMAIKNRLESHKRLIIIASSVGLGAGMFRLILFLSDFHPLSLPIGVLFCSSFIIIGIFYDWITKKTVHPIYWIGLIAILIVELILLPQINIELVGQLNEVLSIIGKNLIIFYS